MFNPDQDSERIIPRKRFDFLKIGSQVLAVIFVLIYIGFDLLAEFLPIIPQIDYQTLIIILVVLIFVMPSGIMLFSKWLQTQKWLALAEEIGFQVEQANRLAMPSLSGTLRGHKMTISQTTQHRGRTRIYFTNYQVALNEQIEDSFIMKKRSLTDFNQTKIGDDQIDKRYTVKSPSKKLMDTILRTRRLRLGLLQLGERARSRTLTLNHTSLTYVERGETADTEYLRAVMGFLSELAHTAERQSQFDM